MRPLRALFGTSLSEPLIERDIALAAVRQQLDQIVKYVPGVVCQFIRDIHGDYHMAFVSDAVEKVFGVTAQQARADIRCIIPGSIHPDDLSALLASIESSYTNAEAWHWEGRIVRIDGEIRSIRGQCLLRKLEDGSAIWDGVLIDTTDDQKAEEALSVAKDEARKLALVAAYTANAVIITDAKGLIEWVNDGFCRITGYTLAEVAGRKPGSFLQGPLTDMAVVAKVREAVASGTPYQTELVNYSKTGVPYWIRIEVQPVRDDAGNLTRFIAIESDITEAKKLADELAKARDAAHLANRAKSEFLANMSHEIRTPLGAVIGFSEMISSDTSATDEDRRQWASTIRHSARHLLTLINDILDISKIEAGRLEIEKVSCSPHAIVGEVASIMRVPASEKGLDLSLRFATPLPEKIQSDPTRLRQVLLNLVNNAIKFTSEGGVRLVVGCDRAGCDRSGDDSSIYIHVVDTGIGMTPEQLGRIFQPFVQADNSVTRRFGGTGLGLTISKHICTSLGGSLTVQSQHGVGSSFTARISAGDIGNVPMIDGQVIASAIPASQPGPGPARLDGIRVLVADDGATNRKLIHLLLSRAGAEVMLATNGVQAMQCLDADPSIQMVLMDMQMPELDGYSATLKLRERGCKTPVVALTASAMTGDRDRCLLAGCNDYLTKPIDQQLLIHTVLRLANPPVTRAPQNPQNPIACNLPVDDPEFAEIAADFLTAVEAKLDSFNDATQKQDWQSLASLGHWLKGAGGNAGYPDVASAAARIEHSAGETALQGVAEAVDEIRGLIPRCRLGLSRVHNQEQPI